MTSLVGPPRFQSPTSNLDPPAPLPMTKANLPKYPATNLSIARNNAVTLNAKTNNNNSDLIKFIKTIFGILVILQDFITLFTCRQFTLCLNCVKDGGGKTWALVVNLQSVIVNASKAATLWPCAVGDGNRDCNPNEPEK